MSRDLLEDSAATLTLSPRVGARPVSASVKWYKPDSSTEVSSGAASLAFSGAKTVTGTPTTQSEFSVDDAANLEVGSEYWMETADGWAGRVRISELTGNALTLETAPPGTVDDSATLRALAFSYDLTASDTENRDTHYRAEWTVVTSSSTEKFNTIHNVVRMQFEPSIDSTDVKRYLDRTFPAVSASEDAGFFSEYARRANERVRLAVQEAGAFCHAIGDASIFRVAAGLSALRLELCLDGYVNAGYDPIELLREYEKAFKRDIRSALSGLQWIDGDDDGVVDVGEVRRPGMIRARRL